MIRVILISSVPPSQGVAGQAVLDRHLANESGIDLVVCNIQPQRGTPREIAWRVLGRLGQIKLFASLSQDVSSLWRGGWIDRELSEPETEDMPTIVMTVAHQEACYAALRYAKKHDLPLVTFFHDWWPDIANVHRPFRSILERSFRDLYAKSDLALCVSHGMMKELGPHKNSRVLLPIPATVDHEKTTVVRPHDRPFKLLYAGNLKEYGPMIIEALKLLKNHPDIRLEVRGNSSSWPASIREEMSNLGLLLPFVPRDELTEWLNTADGFLVTQTFDKKDERLMKTNFPSKLLEFAQFHKPLVMWAPDYASGPFWAKETGMCMVVDQKDPQKLVLALERLRVDMNEVAKFSEAAKGAATSCFDPLSIQAKFMTCLTDVADVGRKN